MKPLTPALSPQEDFSSADNAGSGWNLCTADVRFDTQGLVHCQRGAMGSLFEVWTFGEDEENLEAAGREALDEVQRLERLLSRFDPASEVWRVNQTARDVPVRVSPELWELLRNCREWESGTGGCFSVFAAREGNERGRRRFTFEDSLMMDPASRSVQFFKAEVELDFGGVGKGMAVNAAGQRLRECGIENALVHGGTSSVKGMGPGPSGKGWKVDIGDPYHSERASAFTNLWLVNESLSCSGAGEGTQPQSREALVHVSSGMAIQAPGDCVIRCECAVRAELLSTALASSGVILNRDADWVMLSEKFSLLTNCSLGWYRRTSSGAELNWRRL